MLTVSWPKPIREKDETTGEWKIVGEGRTLAHIIQTPDARKTVCGIQIPETAEPSGDMSCSNCKRQTSNARKPKAYRDLIRPVQSSSIVLDKTAVILGAQPERLHLATESDEIILEGDAGIRTGLARLRDSGAIIYAGGGSDWKALRQLSPSIRWDATVNRKGTVLSFDAPVTIYFLPALQNVTDRRAEMYGLLRFLADHGVKPGSPSAMASSLWKSTLRRSFTPTVYASESILREAFKGGREQASFPGLHQNASYFDLSMAYPTAMQAEPFPLTLRKATRPNLNAPVGIAHAIVRIPEMPWGPLPSRSATHWPTGTQLSGWFALRELRLARDVGVSIQLHEVWEGADYVDLFGDWHALCVKARELADGSTVAKSLANRLWGSFAPNEDAGSVQKITTDGRRLVSGRRGFSSLLYLAVDITARVRERVYREALSNESIGAVYVATDAVIATGIEVPQPYGKDPGTWSRKNWSGKTDVRILWDGAYSYRDTRTGELECDNPMRRDDWQYSMEMTESKRREYFELGWRRYGAGVFHG